MKNMGVTPEYALYEMSYVNLILYGAVTPSYDDAETGEKGFDATLDANDPRNFRGEENETVIKI